MDLVIATAAPPEQLAPIAQQLVQKAFASGLFIFADADLKFDQPQVRVVFDRDKLRSQGIDMSRAGLDLATLIGGDYVMLIARARVAVPNPAEERGAAVPEAEV